MSYYVITIRLLVDDMCARNYKAVHFRLSCNFPEEGEEQVMTRSKLHALERWHIKNTQCSTSSSRHKSCLSRNLIKQLQSALTQTLSVTQFLTDSPSDVLLPEIISMVPHIKVIATYRDPKKWGARRLRTHGPTQLICRPELWNLPTVLHPFDIIGCLLHSTYPSDAVVSLFEYANGAHFDVFKAASEAERSMFSINKSTNVKNIEKGYRAMNTMNMQLVRKKQIPFLPINKWVLTLIRR